MGRFRAVLFDWRGTLVHDPALAWWVGRALESVGRPVARETVDAMAAGLAETAELPEFVEAERGIDCSWELHRSVSMRLFRQAGLDSELAEALYRLDLDPASHPLYPDVPDVLAAIRALGVKIALVSDIHFDLRADLAEQGSPTSSMRMCCPTSTDSKSPTHGSSRSPSTPSAPNPRRRSWWETERHTMAEPSRPASRRC